MTELRLLGAKTIEQANAVLRDFLPRYNAQFAVPAERSDLAYRPWAGNRSLDEILCFKHTRKVARDNTVKYRGAPCSCCPGWSVPATPVSRWKSSNTPTAASRCDMRARSSPIGQRRPGPARYALPMAHWRPHRKSAAS